LDCFDYSESESFEIGFTSEQPEFEGELDEGRRRFSFFKIEKLPNWQNGTLWGSQSINSRYLPEQFLSGQSNNYPGPPPGSN
jgi:hypothetical protein